MMAQIRTSLLLLLLLSALTGLLYPILITAVAQVIFPRQADGSLIRRDGAILGSTLIGQSWIDAQTGRALPGYFRGRPSNAGQGYDAAASGGSNLGPTNAALIALVQERVSQIREENSLSPTAPIPIDLVTSSGSGLDPHISPAAAMLQIPRVARERGRPEADIRALVDEYTESPTLGVLGEPRVNVLALNLALDERYPLPSSDQHTARTP